MGFLRTVFASILGAILIIRAVFRGWRVSRHDGIDMNTAVSAELEQRVAALRAEEDREAEREALLRDVRESRRGLPPPP